MTLRGSNQGSHSDSDLKKINQKKPGMPPLLRFNYHHGHCSKQLILEQINLQTCQRLQGAASLIIHTDNERR